MSYDQTARPPAEPQSAGPQAGPEGGPDGGPDRGPGGGQTERAAMDALGAITDFEKSIRGLKKLYEERKEVEAKLIEAQTRLVARETELAQQTQELHQAIAAREESEKAAKRMREELDARESALRDAQAAIASAAAEREEQSRQAEVRAKEQAAADERTRALAKELDEFASELHKAQEELEREKAEVAAGRESLLENAMALKAQQSEVESRAAESQSELADRRAELDALAARLASEQAQAAATASGDADLARRLEAESQACEQLRQDVERIARRCAAQEEVLAEYEQLLAVERSHVHELILAIQTGDAAPEETRKNLEELKGCLAHEREERESLHRQITELRASRNSGKAVPTTKGITALRQRRLKRCRAILREHVGKVRKASEVLAKRFEQCEQVLSQRAQLAGTKRQLDIAAAALAKRAAAKRAGVLTMCIVATIAILAGLSWAAVGQAWPGDFAARAEITADGRGRELSDGELDEWRRSLEASLADPQFAETVAGRMRQRGYESAGTAGAVRTLLTGSFNHDSPSPGVLTLELRAPGRERAARMLDIFTTTLASDANAAREHRADGAVTLIKGPAAAGTEPINDQRLPRAGIVLISSVVLTLGLGFLVWSRLSRAKEEFELGSQIDQVLDEAKWSEFTAATTNARPGTNTAQ